MKSSEGPKGWEGCYHRVTNLPVLPDKFHFEDEGVTCLGTSGDTVLDLLGELEGSTTKVGGLINWSALFCTPMATPASQELFRLKRSKQGHKISEELCSSRKRYENELLSNEHILER